MALFNCLFILPLTNSTFVDICAVVSVVYRLISYKAALICIIPASLNRNLGKLCLPANSPIRYEMVMVLVIVMMLLGKTSKNDHFTVCLAARGGGGAVSHFGPDRMQM